MMPSPYTSQTSLDDAAEAARLMGVDLDSVDIEPAMRAFGEMLEPLLNGYAPDANPRDTTEENIQARSRRLTLMAISNRLGYMVLSTGTKSAVSVGSAPLCGAMASAFHVMKDPYKTPASAPPRCSTHVIPTAPPGRAG